MVEIELKNGQTGYDVVEEYVRRYWKHKEMTDTVVVSIGISRTGEVYEHINEVVSPCDCDVEFLYDWWEGEKFIRIFGIKSLDGFNITGGIYEDNI